MADADGRAPLRSVSGLAPHHRTLLGRATIGDQLRRHAATQPGKLALIAYDADGTRREVPYGALDERANRFARLFVELGVARGDRVASMAPNLVDVVAAYYGALKAGAAFTGVNPFHRASEVAHQLEHSRAAVVLADAGQADVVAQALPPGVTTLTYGSDLDDRLAAQPGSEPEVELDENDLALVVYTSGTEAAPKGVMIPHRNYLASTAPAWGWGLETGPDDTWLFVMPFHTIAGLGSMTSLTLMGATLVLPASTDPAGALAIIARERITVVAQTPTFYVALSAQEAFGPDTVGQVRRAMTYGGQIPPHVLDTWARAAPEVRWGTYWGQSELSQLGTVGFFRRLDDVPDRDPTWIGKPVTHLEVRVVDDDGNDAGTGELLCRSPSVMLGYLDDPERTAEVFRDGWVHTGDIVRRDADGNLFFSDRLKDVIKSGGMNVSSQEVERVLGAHPGVQRVAVVGVPDPYWSEAVTAFVVPSAEAGGDLGDDLIARARDELASYKVPKSVHVVESLPTDPQGKILKRELRGLD